ncbi:hypothetical protein CASFOL_031832 [Castilleja foliolosa]|uniref:DUF7953 domain-containing protein n=1 Tax=Castilleja foliolosa TaxID=1961234 RepID=A0ABD3BZU4_9LAMI
MGAARISVAIIRRRFGPKVPFLVLLSCTILISYWPASVLAADVTLNSMEIFKTHEWLPSKPTVYFQCKGEDKISLPDVKDKNVLYTFKGEESWQPLTQIQDKKCKRCGIYEKDPIKTVELDEWELCPSDFTSDGKYIHFKEREFNATLQCPECVSLGGQASNHSETQTKPKTDSEPESNELRWAIIAAIIVVVSGVFIAGLVSICKYCQKRKRQQQQARFLKLFEETDDIEDELGIGPLSHAI